MKFKPEHNKCSWLTEINRQQSSSHTLGLVSPSYLGTLVGARKHEGNFASQMLRPKAREPYWFGDQLRSRSSSLSWRRLRPRSSWWRERLSRLLSTLLAHRRASIVFRASRLGPSRLLTADVAAPTPSPRSRCWEKGGFGPWADGTPARPRSERWREAELSA
jgi:hypothetical protein